MFDSTVYFAVLAVALVLLGLVAPPLLAARKGYAWQLWTIPGGLLLLGLIVMAFLPYANKGDASPEVNEARRQTGNTVGAVLSVLGLLVFLLRVVKVWPFGR
jgi:hypothetical protein